jgi:hypothetical protein
VRYLSRQMRALQIERIWSVHYRNKATPSSACDTDHYVIIRKSLDFSFSVLPLLGLRREIQTHFTGLFFRNIATRSMTCDVHKVDELYVHVCLYPGHVQSAIRSTGIGTEFLEPDQNECYGEVCQVAEQENKELLQMFMH